MGTGGRFVRQSSQFRDWVERSDDARYPAAAGRYHLYVSYACPWAHRTIILRRLKGLEEIVGMSVVDPIRDERGWAFREGPNHGVDPINGFGFLAEAYLASDSSFASRVTVPVLWDTESGRIVSNESADILQMLNSAFDEWGDTSLDLYPEELRAQIDEVNAFVYGKHFAEKLAAVFEVDLDHANEIQLDDLANPRSLKGAAQMGARLLSPLL